jgi:multiple sugar transport system substrate-binding protein
MNFSHHELTRRGFVGVSLAGLVAAAAAGCTATGGASATDTFTFSFWGAGNEKQKVTGAVNAFAKTKSLKALPLNIDYANYAAKINAMLAGGTPPDCGYLLEGLAMQLGEKGKVLSITDQASFDSWLPSTKQYWSPDGAIAGPPQVVLMFYSTEATKAAGVKPPTSLDTAWNWDSFVDQCFKLTKDSAGKSPSETGFNPDATAQYALAVPTDLPSLHALFKSNGLELFSEDGMECRIDSPEAIEVIQNLADLIFEHRVAPKPEQAQSFGASPALLIQSGRVAMAVSGQWNLLDFSQGHTPYGIGVLPTYGEKFVSVIGGAYGVFANTKRTADSFEFLNYLGSPEKVDLYSQGLWMPTEKKYYTEDKFIDQWVNDKVHTSAYRTVALDPMLKHPAPYFSFRVKNFPEISSVLNGGLTPLFAEKSDIPARLKDLAQKVKPLLQGAYVQPK